jgi:hypothetical protein
VPHIPDVRAHATHAPELIAAYAAGDATGRDLETATALVAACAECSTLHHDLRAIAVALPELPAPVRSRDFRLTPEQAASLRPTGWRRVLGVLAGPRFAFAAPLGTGLATLGIAGILLGTIAGAPLVPLGGATGAQREGTEQLLNSEIPAPAASPAAASAPAASTVPDRVSQHSDAPPEMEPDVAGSPAPSGGGVDTAAGEPAGSPVFGAAADPGSETAHETPGDDTKAATFAADGDLTGNATDAMLVGIGGSALLVGLILVGLRWGSRRVARVR